MNPTDTSGYIFYNALTKNDNDSLNDDLKKVLKKNKKPITFGKCSRFYLYILGSGSFKMLSSLILGSNKDKENEFGLFGFCPVLNQYNFIQSIYTYIGYFIQSIYTYIGYIIFGLIFYYFKYPDKSDLKEKKENKENYDFPKRVRALYKNISETKNIDKVKKNINLKIFFLCVVFAVHIETKKVLYIQGFQYFNLWTTEIIFMQWLMRKYFTIDYYKHHKISLLFNSIFCSSILILTTFLPNSLYEDGKENSFQNIKKKLGSYFYGLLLIVVYMVLSVAFCFTRIYSKVLMQIKFISPYKLVFSDNLVNYFSSMKSVLDKGETYQFYGEIFLVSPTCAFANAMEFIFEILTIYYLNPFYILLSNTLYYTISQLIYFMLNLSSDRLVIIHFIITELTEFFTCLGLMVYLEVIELNCWGLNYDLKKTIMEKAEIEFKLLNDSKIEEEEDDDKSNA